MNRRNQILAALLAVQLVLVAVVFWPRNTASGEAQNLFPEVDVDTIARVTITDNEGGSIQFAKSGGQWVLPNAGDYPVLDNKVPELLERIVNLTGGRLVTQTSNSHKRLEVAADEFQRRIEFDLTDNTRYRLYVGSSPAYGATHIRVDGQDQVYLTSDLSATDSAVAASSWVDTNYLTIASDEMVAVTIENPSGTLSFGKSGDTWTMEGLADGEILNTSAVTSLVNRAAKITLQSPLGKEEDPTYGLQSPSAIVTVETKNEESGSQTYKLRVGAKSAEGNTYVVSSSESEYYVRVSEFAVKDLVEKTRDDMLQQPTPVPEATPGG